MGGGTPPIVHYVVRTSVSQVLLAVAVDALRGDALSLQRHAQVLAAHLVERAGWGGKNPPQKPAAEPPSRWPGKSIALSLSLSLRYI
jgi:hypothetical protein